MLTSISQMEARRVALAATGLTGDYRPTEPGRRQISNVFQRLGTIQIDSVNVFSRTHYMPVFSRLGAYDRSIFDNLVFAQGSPYTEYWPHEAGFIPLSDWALFDFRMRDQRASYGGPDSWFSHHQQAVNWVLDELKDRGPSKPSHIEGDLQVARGPWWDWSDTKRALETLYRFGDVAIAGRDGFERLYALPSEVIPSTYLDAPVPEDVAIRELMRRAVRAFGVGTAADLADYYRLDRKRAQKALQELVDEGVALPVQVRGWEHRGKPVAAFADASAKIPRKTGRAALLSPFDPLVWYRDRALRMFGMDYRIEIYTPRHKRQFGYYSLPVLVDDRLAARVDLKADRATKTLLVQSAWWNAGEHRREDAARIVTELQRAAGWQGLETISIAGWGDAVDDLAAELEGCGRH